MPEDDEVDVAESAETPEHGAQSGRCGDRPRFVDTLDPGAMYFGLHVPDGADRGTVARVFGVGCGDDHIAEEPHSPGEHMQPDRINTVVVCNQNAHRTTLSAPVIAPSPDGHTTQNQWGGISH